MSRRGRRCMHAHTYAQTHWQLVTNSERQISAIADWPVWSKCAIDRAWWLLWSASVRASEFEGIVNLGFVANSKYKIQALFEDCQGPKLHFSSTKIIDKKPYCRRGHSKFRLQCDTDAQWEFWLSKEASKVKSNTVSKYWWHAYKCLLQNCQQMQNFKTCKI